MHSVWRQWAGRKAVPEMGDVSAKVPEGFDKLDFSQGMRSSWRVVVWVESDTTTCLLNVHKGTYDFSDFSCSSPSMSHVSPSITYNKPVIEIS
jgi:hypothetical protein